MAESTLFTTENILPIFCFYRSCLLLFFFFGIYYLFYSEFISIDPFLCYRTLKRRPYKI